MLDPARPRPLDPLVSVVVPARNEAANLPLVLDLLPPSLHEVIVVDGRSDDGTADVARRHRHRHRHRTRVIHQTRRGKGDALALGFLAATGDVVVMLDADGSTDPREIPAFVEALVAGADLAKGTRFGPGGHSHDITPVRRSGNQALATLVNVLYGTRHSDLCYGYNAFWADTLPVLLPPALLRDRDRPGGELEWGEGFEIETLMTLRAAVGRLRVTEVPSVEAPRIFGTSNLHATRDGWRVLRTILAERFRTRRVPAAAPGAPLADPGPDEAAA